MTKEQFITELLKLNITLSEEQLNNLDKYYNLLVSYNEKVNLTAITKEEDVYLKHFYDSLTLIKSVDLKDNLTLCDIGTGAGFPGLVLKICFPNLKITLIDALEKRIKFLDLVIDELQLKEIKTIHSRIEDFKEYERFDIVVSRAVSHTRVILELGCQLPKINGYFILMKGNVDIELKEATNCIEKLNYILKDVISFKLPIENSERNLVVLQKKDKTNNKYPRPFNKIKLNNL